METKSLRELAELIRGRRTINLYLQTPVPRDLVLQAIEVATWAPNHHVTEPWHFYLLGPDSIGRCLDLCHEIVAASKGADAADFKRQSWSEKPGWLVVTCRRSEDALREREDYAGRRLLENLQERVPCIPRQHVRLVDDIDLVPLVRGGRVHGSLSEVASVFHAPVAGGVALHHIKRGTTRPDSLARLALAAWLAALPGGTIERHCQDAGGGGLSDAARTAEEVSMRDAARLDGGPQRRTHMVLSDQLLEPAGPMRSC